MVKILTGLYIKFKPYIIAIVVGYISSTIRYIDHKRKLREGRLDKKVKVIKFTDWFLFGCMASIITMTGVAIIEYMGYEFTTPMVLLIFWMGYMTDYLFQWIPIMLKNKFEKFSQKKPSGTD